MNMHERHWAESVMVQIRAERERGSLAIEFKPPVEAITVFAPKEALPVAVESLVRVETPEHATPPQALTL